MNRTLRSYHSGETGDLDFFIQRIVAEHSRPLVLAGISLGGNVLLKWLGENGSKLPRAIAGAAAVSVPFDLARSARNLEHGFARIYQERFLRSLRRKALLKIERYPGYANPLAVRCASTLRAFDTTVTAPVHGFRNAEDYYARSSSLGFLPRIRLPTLLLSARDDPFLPPDVLTEVEMIGRRNRYLFVEQPAHGGHVGFVAGSLPWRPKYYVENRVGEFLAGVLAIHRRSNPHGMIA
ncbi:MAG: hypothetical protein NVSMB22_00210 [Chloroflexota bacterium]